MGRQKDAGKTIGEVEKLTGIPKRTLKYYIERGLLTPQRKSSSGYWLYSEEDIRRLRLIFLCRELEYSDSGIRTLLAAPEVRWQEELDRQIDLLLEQRGQTEEKLVAAELMRCCWRTRGTLERDAGALSPALGELFEKDRPPRLRAGAREELCRTIYGALSEALGTDRPPECLKKLLREDPARRGPRRCARCSGRGRGCPRRRCCLRSGCQAPSAAWTCCWTRCWDKRARPGP